MPLLGLISKGEIKEVRNLKDAEYEGYIKAATRLLSFSSDQQLFRIARLNYDDYGNLLKRYFEEYSKNPSLDWPRVERMTLNINRHILNYLSAVRTFLDHWRTNLVRRYGRSSQRVRHFEDACSWTYENSFSYRFLYKLRNYVQHCGMPLGQLTLHSKVVGPSSKDVHHFLAVEFNRDELLEKFSWGSQLTKEIQELPPTFDINPHITEMMKCLERINLAFIGDDLPELIQSAEYIQKLVAETKDMPGIPCILEIEDLVRTQEGRVRQLSLGIKWIPLHLVEMIMRAKRIQALSDQKGAL